MKALEDKIVAYVSNPENITSALALMKVSRIDNKEDLEVVIAKVIADALLRFHGIPLTPQPRN